MKFENKYNIRNEFLVLINISEIFLIYLEPKDSFLRRFLLPRLGLIAFVVPNKATVYESQTFFVFRNQIVFDNRLK
jgi:hypothetical protein